MTPLRLVMLSTALLSACASIVPLAYAVQPQRITDPKAEVRQLVLANTVQGCVTETEFTGAMLVVKAVCSQGVGNQVVRLDRVKSIVLEQSGEWYRCRVVHSPGIADFWWSSKSLEDMQRMADAFSALTGANPAADAPAADTSKI